MRLIDADALHEALKTKQRWVVRCGDKHNEGYTYDQVHFAIDEAPTIEPKAKVIAQVTFDEEKMREIVKEAVERFKEEYEIEPKRGEWVNKDSYWHTAICSNCNKVTMFEEWDEKVIEYDFCPNCGADMREREGE